MYQSWSWLTFLHWSYPPEVLQRLLPSSLRVHDFDGRAWVGVTPFVLGDLRTPVAPAPPWFSRFPETNVRTYVVGPDGRTGSGSSPWTRPGWSRCWSPARPMCCPTCGRR
jgi:uncharacterized protein YqjF (DUF2071 family)